VHFIIPIRYTRRVVWGMSVCLRVEDGAQQCEGRWCAHNMLVQVLKGRAHVLRVQAVPASQEQTSTL
jgi:hypothetical protein